MLAPMREALDQQFPRSRKPAAVILHLQPFAHIIGKAAPPRPISQHRLHPRGQMGGERQSQPAVAGDGGRFPGRAHHHVHVLHAFDFKAHAGEKEGVTGGKLGGKPFLHLAEAAPVLEPHGEHFAVDNDARIHPVTLRLIGVGQPPDP